MNSKNQEKVQLPCLETFSKAAELNSFTATAKALGLTQAAISQRIQTLEKMLGASLFHRQGGRILLTEAGQQLYSYAQRIFELHRNARQAVTGRKPPISGELFLGASTIPGEYFLPAILSVFHKRFPLIEVRATVSDSMGVIRQVEHGEVQLGLLPGLVRTYAPAGQAPVVRLIVRGETKKNFFFLLVALTTFSTMR